MNNAPESPELATLDRLPEILGIGSRDVVRAIKHRPEASFVKQMGSTREISSLPPIVLYKVRECRKALEAGLPEKPIAPVEFFERKERIRRLRVLADHMFAEHGISLRMGQERHKQKGWQVALESGRWLQLVEGTAPVLVASLFVLPDLEDEMRAYLASSKDDRLPQLSERIRMQTAELAPRIEQEIVDAVSIWRGQTNDATRSEATRAAQQAVVEQRLRTGLFFIAYGLNRIAASIRHQLEGVREEGETKAQEIEERLELQRRTGYDRYPNIFPAARRMQRRLTLLVGPTNSGKTHEALEIASKAESAQVLSPLRLLALEHRDALVARGLDAGLVTGEERENVDASHLARTIETVDLVRPTDVAIIDEIQMLDDKGRGWAWTQAMIGVPAKHVALTGSPTAIPIVQRIAEELGESLDIRFMERKNQLRRMHAPLSIKDLKPGDAVIAFTRSDIHDLRERIRDAGRSVATIYGALGPEVRRSEARRFREGEAEILVATDAIGMGLNLPIRRVLFSTTQKFNGFSRKPLKAADILQIAGRAGRHGHYEGGYVGVLAGDSARTDASRIETAMLAGAPELTGKAFVRPNLGAIEMTANIFETKSLRPVLEHLAKNLVKDHPALRMADLGEELFKAQRLDALDLPLPVRYGYAIAPINLKSTAQLDRLLSWARQHALHDRVEPYEGVDAGAPLDLLETSAQISVAWLWLAQRFPAQYQGAEIVRAARLRTNEAIEKRLIQSSIARVKRSKEKASRTAFGR